MSGRDPQPGEPPIARLLVVEDEPILALDLERSLDDLGYEVVGVADSARRALAMAQKHQPDLVLMDVRLRGSIDGIEAAGEIRRRWKTPVVFTTAYSSDETLERARLISPSGFLVKPFHAEELHATIAMALDQHRLEERLTASQAWLTTLLHSIRDGVIATDSDGVVRFINPVAEELTGWRRKEAVGKQLEEIYPLLDLEGRPLENPPLRRALASARPRRKTRFLLRRRDGSELPVEDATAPFGGDDTVGGAVTVFADVSDQIRAEVARAARRVQLEDRIERTRARLGESRSEIRALAASLMRAREEEGERIARELHDDFGQRIALLAIEAETLRSGSEDAETRRGLERIGHRAETLAEDMRTLSHRLHPSMISQLGLVDALRALVSEARLEGDVETEFSAEVEAAKLAPTSSIALYRIAQEALRNAAKHASRSPVRLALWLQDGQVRMTVEDEGDGFDVEAVRAAGEGIGLISMRERARLAGGDLRVTSAPGEGTTVEAALPVD